MTHYLATPYSRYEGGLEAAWIDACRVSGALMRNGFKVFSPIAHSHGIAVHGGLDPLDHEIWLPADESFMEHCEGLIVARLEGWETSKGVAFEIMKFKEAGKPIEYVDFDVESGELK